MQFYNNKLIHNKTDSEMIKDLALAREWGVIAERHADADDCTQCGRCEMACTQHLDIINRLGEIAEWETALKT